MDLSGRHRLRNPICSESLTPSSYGLHLPLNDGRAYTWNNPSTSRIHIKRRRFRSSLPFVIEHLASNRIDHRMGSSISAPTSNATDTWLRRDDDLARNLNLFFFLGSGHLFPAFPTPAHCPFLLFCCFLQQKKKHKHRTKNPLVLSATVMTGARKRREMCRDTKQQMGNIEIKEAGPCV